MENILNKVKSIFKKDQRSPEEMMLEAKIKLNTAREDYLNVIDKELRNLRYNKANHIGGSENDHSMLVIKKALFGISLIDRTMRELNSTRTLKQLFNALNITTEAMKILNKAEKYSPVPNEKALMKAIDRFSISRDSDRERLEGLFNELEDADTLVSDEAVERLVKDDHELGRIQREKVLSYTADTFGTIFDDSEFMESFEPYDPGI